MTEIATVYSILAQDIFGLRYIYKQDELIGKTTINFCVEFQ